MSRIPALDPAAVQGKAGDLLGAVQKSLGLTPNLFRVLANAPAALEGVLGLNGALSGGRLPARSREAIAITVAEMNGCDYCLSAHTAIGKNLGLGEAQVSAARQGLSEDPKLQAALVFARTVVLSKGRVSDAEVNRVRAAGLDDGAIVEIVAHVAMNILTNYLNNVAETEIDFPVVRAGTVHAA
ncbi:carboxymuconolactone decarboxylase family protein [Methyloraptor flagellatus]|uniref:Carboxymuconolactone decarboxylase family protein n=1 Tax=Methyloraptor flagellatus TaxID=3162530 RepID=A0AAU7XDM2_9HYPH